MYHDSGLVVRDSGLVVERSMVLLGYLIRCKGKAMKHKPYNLI